MLKVGWIQWEGFIVFGVQTKLEPLLLAHLNALTIVENELKIRKLQTSKSEKKEGVDVT